jgi:hypothetical protein
MSSTWRVTCAGCVIPQGSLGADFFQLPTSIWDELAAEGQAWTANRAFLDWLIKNGQSVIFASDLSEATANSPFAMEIEYLLQHGYAFMEGACL